MVFVEYHSKSLTESTVLLIQFAILPPLGTSTKQPVEEDVEVAEDDERWRQDGAVVERHDELISLELPHLVGNGLDFKESVAVGNEETNTSEWML